VTAKSICAVRDEFRRAGPELPRLIFCDIMIPHQSPASQAGGAALRMVEAGVDAVGIHLQSDARRATPKLIEDDYLGDVVAPSSNASARPPRCRRSAGSALHRLSALPGSACAPSCLAAIWACRTATPVTTCPRLRFSAWSPVSSPRSRALAARKKTGFPRVRKAGVKPNPSSQGGPVRSLRIRTGSEAGAVCCAVPERWLPRRSRSCAASAGSGSGCHRC
jgi:hypothetical protein